jgi:hypothetical protein
MYSIYYIVCDMHELQFVKCVLREIVNISPYVVTCLA